MNIKKLIAIFLLVLSGCEQRTIKPEVPRRTITICSGCGSEWESNGPSEPIDKCPNCPMTPEEFEALKEQVRNRKVKEVGNE